MVFCLLPKFVDKFKQGLVEGKINPTKLSEMTSQERNKYLAEFVGEENATQVNALFESKLLLKNQQQGMITWAKTVAGLKPEVKRDLISRIERLDKVLNLVEQEQFMKDLASTKLGFDVTREEAKAIADSTAKMTKARDEMEQGGDRMNYGRARVALENYVVELKENAGKFYLADLKNIKSIIGAVSKLPSEIAGNAKAVKASLDNSAIFRQGWKTLWTNPGIWAKNAKKSFSDIVQTFGGKQVIDEIRADIISRPNYDLYRKARLAIGTVEEAFPTSLPEKIPGLGRAYKASETAYTGFVYRQRVDVFDKYMEIAQKSGVNINDREQLESIGRLVNSLTGRGKVGAADKTSGFVNNVFFSIRNLKSNFDTLTMHQGQGETLFVKQQAAINLLKIVSGTAAILGLAKAIKEDSVDFDPRSADFGKIKVGHTRFDVSGGMSSIITLATREISGATKSSTTGKITRLDSGDFGAPTRKGMVYDFFENKLSPAASVIKQLMDNRDYEGNKPTIASSLKSLFLPFPVSNYMELKKDPESADALLAMIADALGIGINTYGPKTPEEKRKQEINVLEDLISQRNKKIKEQVQKGDYPEFNKLSPTDRASIKSSITKEDKKEDKYSEARLQKLKERFGK